MANPVGVEERQTLCDVNDFEVTGVIGYDPTDAIVTVLLRVICYVTVRAENISELIPAARKIEFESCK